MHQRARPDQAWYRRKILDSQGSDVMAGPLPPDFAQPEEPEARLAFGAFVRLERREKKLSLSEFANRLHVDESELRQIEHDPSYQAKPRTIVSIADYLSVPTKALIKLSGAAQCKDPGFSATAMKFAAHSDDIVGLTAEEHAMLEEFVRFLRHS
jgi:transcriptional regulator with XRE-family HTH domain